MIGRAPNTKHTNTYGGRSCLPLTHTQISWEMEVLLLNYAICYAVCYAMLFVYAINAEIAIFHLLLKKTKSAVGAYWTTVKTWGILNYLHILNCFSRILSCMIMLWCTIPEKISFTFFQSLKEFANCMKIVLDIKAKSPTSVMMLCN